MILGDLLARVEEADSAGNITALLDDLSLMARIAAVAAQEGIDPDQYIVGAVRRFERDATGDDWATLISAVARHPNPGSACLRCMVERALTADAADVRIDGNIP